MRGLIVMIILTGCTITITPIQNKPVKQTHHKHTTVKHKAKVNGSRIVDSNWIERYRQLENAAGNYVIKDDVDIKPLPNGKFEVPDHVMNHYQDLVLAAKPEE